jgi:hypothetical protein
LAPILGSTRGREDRILNKEIAKVSKRDSVFTASILQKGAAI